MEWIRTYDRIPPKSGHYLVFASEVLRTESEDVSPYLVDYWDNDRVGFDEYEDAEYWMEIPLVNKSLWEIDVDKAKDVLTYIAPK